MLTVYDNTFVAVILLSDVRNKRFKKLKVDQRTTTWVDHPNTGRSQKVTTGPGKIDRARSPFVPKHQRRLTGKKNGRPSKKHNLEHSYQRSSMTHCIIFFGIWTHTSCYRLAKSLKISLTGIFMEKKIPQKNMWI